MKEREEDYVDIYMQREDEIAVLWMERRDQWERMMVEVYSRGLFGNCRLDYEKDIESKRRCRYSYFWYLN